MQQAHVVKKMTHNIDSMPDDQLPTVPALSDTTASQESTLPSTQPDTTNVDTLPLPLSSAVSAANSDEINNPSQLDEEQTNLETSSGTRNSGAATTNAVILKIFRPSDIETPRKINGLPERGSTAFSLFEARIRHDATLALAIMHPIVAYASRTGIQGYSNMEYASLMRLQTQSVAVVLVQDSKTVRFLRSPSGSTLERLIHSTTSEERLALDTQLRNPEIWGNLFESPYSDELAAGLIGVSLKTLRSYRNRQEGGQ